MAANQPSYIHDLANPGNHFFWYMNASPIYGLDRAKIISEKQDICLYQVRHAKVSVNYPIQNKLNRYLVVIDDLQIQQGHAVQ